MTLSPGLSLSGLLDVTVIGDTRCRRLSFLQPRPSEVVGRPGEALLRLPRRLRPFLAASTSRRFLSGVLVNHRDSPFILRLALLHLVPRKMVGLFYRRRISGLSAGFTLEPASESALSSPVSTLFSPASALFSPWDVTCCRNSSDAVKALSGNISELTG